MRKIIHRYSLCILFQVFTILGASQTVIIEPCADVIIPELQNLLTVPDARSSGMGNTGVMLSPSAASIFHNTAALAFTENTYGISAGYLNNINYGGVRSLSHLAAYYKINAKNAVAFEGSYYSLGKTSYADISGNIIQTSNRYESALEFGYALKLAEDFSFSADIKYLREDYGNLDIIIPTGVLRFRPGNSVAADLGFYYRKKIESATKNKVVTAGVSINNLGNKIAYQTTTKENYLPAKVSAGIGYAIDIDANNSINYAVQFNKLLVPAINGTATDYYNYSLLTSIFKSFGDAPCGGKGELNEVTIGLGAEYWYKKLIALRAGYYYENKEISNKRYFTGGGSINYNNFDVDLSYLFYLKKDVNINNNYEKIFRLTINYVFKKKNEES